MTVSFVSMERIAPPLLVRNKLFNLSRQQFQFLLSILDIIIRRSCKLYLQLCNGYGLKAPDLCMVLNKIEHNEKNINTWTINGSICSIQLQGQRNSCS